KTFGAEMPYAENKGDKLIHSSLRADTVFHEVSRAEGPKGHTLKLMYVQLMCSQNQKQIVYIVWGGQRVEMEETKGRG
ncbi:MAG: hypothetical protein ACLQVL_23085, partial [Terriglobia bacterium]